MVKKQLYLVCNNLQFMLVESIRSLDTPIEEDMIIKQMIWSGPRSGGTPYYVFKFK